MQALTSASSFARRGRGAAFRAAEAGARRADACARNLVDPERAPWCTPHTVLHRGIDRVPARSPLEHRLTPTGQPITL
jgi:hypothetical protein